MNASTMMTRSVQSAAATNVADATPIATAVAAVAVAPTAQRTEPTKLIYKVKRGDTLFSIARVFHTSVSALKSWNRLRTNAIRVGDPLTIFTSRAVAD